MATMIWGIVKEGKIVPETPLPEGLHVRITLPEETAGVPPELQAELEAWSLGSAEALALVERLAEEGRGGKDPHA
jgi:hypothetical protein